MPVARFLFRVAFRARWRAWTAIGLFAGIAGGVVLVAAAGARRTDSAPERVVADEPRGRRARQSQQRFPHRRAVARARGPAGGRGLGAGRGRRDAAAGCGRHARYDVHRVSRREPRRRAIPDGHELRTIDRPGVVAGRLPDPDDEHALVVNESAARQRHLRVGSQLRVGFYRVADLHSRARPAPSPSPRSSGRCAWRRSCGRSTTQRALLTIRASTHRGCLTPALSHRIAPFGSLFGGLAVKLYDPAQLGELRARGAAHRGLQCPRPTGDQRHAAARHVGGTARTCSRSWLFAALAALAGGGVVGQLAGRQQRGEITRSRRCARWARRVAIWSPRPRCAASFIGGIAAVVAVVVAWFGSAPMPIGPMRALEPHRGMDFDPTVIGWGAARRARAAHRCWASESRCGAGPRGRSARPGWAMRWPAPVRPCPPSRAFASRWIPARARPRCPSGRPSSASGSRSRRSSPPSAMPPA